MTILLPSYKSTKGSKDAMLLKVTIIPSILFHCGEDEDI